MSILIKGMELPKEFDPDVYIELACGIEAKQYARLYNFHQGGLTEWCEVVPVSSHGDLIDREELEHTISQFSLNWEYGQGVSDCWDALLNAPTIIEAEKDE